MKINSFNLSNTQLFSANTRTVNKAAELINNKTENQAVALELSKEGMQRLKIRNLFKAEAIQTKIDEGLEAARQKLDFLTEVDKSIEEILKEISNYIENLGEEIQEATDDDAVDPEAMTELDGTVDPIVNEALLEEPTEEIKHIEGLINDLADMLEAVEKNKAQREGTEYIEDDSLAQDLRGIDFSKDHIKAIGLLNGAKSLIMEEIQELYKQIGEMQKQVDNLLGIEPKDKDSSQQQGLEEMLAAIKAVFDIEKE